MRPRHVLSVGQCGFDHRRITKFFQDAFGIVVTRAETSEEAFEAIRGGWFDLILVNRIFDADDTSGLDFIRELKSSPPLAALPTMLVSNYAEAQAEAVGLGANAGFGKEDLRGTKARELVQAVLST